MSLRDVVTNSRYLGEEDYVTRGAAAVYRSLLHLMPASVGSWFTEIKNRQMISDIEKYTSVNETPRLIGLELETISSRGDLEVVALHNKSQVVTRYRKDDSTLELVIKLPGSFPLRPVEVEFTSTFGFGRPCSASGCCPWVLPKKPGWHHRRYHLHVVPERGEAIRGSGGVHSATPSSTL